MVYQQIFDAIVLPFVQTMLENLRSAILQNIYDVYGVRDEVNSLERTLQTVQRVLKDAEAKQRKNEELNQWLVELKDAAYNAENIVDLVATDVLRQQMDRERGKRLKHSFDLDMFPQISIARRVKEVRGKLDAIADEKTKFHLSDGIQTDSYIGEDRQTGSLLENELEIKGRDIEKNLLIVKILDVMHSQTDLVVYVLCGMGGIGKTTLAQLVYNDDKVKNHFELRAWVCVSDDFSAKRLTKAIIESIDGRPCDLNDFNTLQHLLQGKLRDKRYILVLDDVWSEDREKWDKLKEALRCGSNGSVVIVTTRNEKVAIMMDSIHTHKLQCLNDCDSRTLFRQRAFANKEMDGRLDEIGKKIVIKCGGVPLAVKALGSLMSFKSTENEWEAIQNSEIWELSDEENGILPALRLSYDNLPHHLKQCIAYCCIFPKDYDMEKNELIQLWMANGFIPSQVHKNLAQSGREIFQELVWRSFFQDVREVEKFGKYKTLCKMHDLMHDLAQSFMRHETTCIMENNSNVSKNLKMLRHLSFTKRHASLELSNVVSLRSLIVHPESYGFTEEDLSNQKYLRALKLQGRFSDYVFKLQLLRHLVLNVFNCTSLPESLTHLYNLQSLKLVYSDDLHEFPKDLKYLKNLYFLEMDGVRSLVSTPPDLGELKYLQTLSFFIVGEDPSHQLHQLKNLDLEGELTIQGLYYVRIFEDAKSANLIAKKNLICLTLKWKIDGLKRNHDYPIMKGLFDEVLEGLQPNQNLKEIKISYFPGSRLPKWLSSSHLKNLKKIYLYSCDRLEHLPPLGEFPHLNRLTLWKMNSIKHLNVEWHGDGEASFPSLEFLRIRCMDVLEEWIVPVGHGHFASLKELQFSSCNQLLSIPAALLEMVSSTLVVLEINSCPKLESLPESMKQLTALQTLSLRECEGFHSFPDCLWSLPSLTMLEIHDLPKLERLPEIMQQQSALRKLELSGCNRLRSLPDGLRSLNSLALLKIYKRPLLEERCRKPNGEDWHKISHIPKIEINHKTIQSLDG